MLYKLYIIINILYTLHTIILELFLKCNANN